MTNDPNNAQKPDWNKLATEALDLWQNHLNALASDPKVKEEMTRFVTPMSQMFSQWTTMMQSGLQGMAGFAPQAAGQAATPTDETPETAERTPTAGPDAQDEADNDEDADNSYSDDEIDEDAFEDGDEDEDRTMMAYDEQNENAPEEGAAEDVRPDAAIDTRGATGQDNVVRQNTTATDTAIPAAKPPNRGRAASADGSRDLAQLAGRLAQLERELDSLRPRKQRGATAAATASDSDTAADGAVQRVAGAD